MSEEEIEGFRSRMQDLLDRFENNNNIPTEQEVLRFLEEINQLDDPNNIAQILNLHSDIYQNTLLHFAVIFENPNIVDILINSGHVNLIAENFQNETPRDIAVRMLDSPQNIKRAIILENLNKARVRGTRGGKKKKIKQNRSNKKTKTKHKRNKRRTFRYFL